MNLLVITLFSFLMTSAANPQPTGGKDMQNITISRRGSQPSSQRQAEYFTGSARVETLFPVEEPSRIAGARVTFEPGARTAWHTHPLGQTLIVTAGAGWIQRQGGPVEEMREGDVVRIPAGVKHWHGATRMTHIALQEQLDGKVVEWSMSATSSTGGPEEGRKEKYARNSSLRTARPPVRRP